MSNAYDPELESSLTGNSKTFRLKTKWMHDNVYIVLGQRYHDGSVAWQLIDAEDNLPMAKATVCMSSECLKPKDGHVFIKSWGENEGMYEGLKKAGLVDECIERISVGHVIDGVYHCPINYKGLIG